MSIRDQILAVADELKSETVVVPEWGDLKLTVRELNARDRNAFLDTYTKTVEDAGGEFHTVPVDDPLRQARLVILSTFDESGERVFEDGDAEALGQRAASALDRLSKVAVRLSGLNQAQADDAGKGSDSTPADGSSTD